MKFLSLIDSFKGSLSSLKISNIVKRSFPDSDAYPFSDGGEGFLDFIKFCKTGKSYYLRAEDLNSELKKVELFIDTDNCAYFEAAKLLGKPSNKSIFLRTSKGIYTVMKEVDKLNVKTLYISIGGSLTQDMGLGVLNEIFDFYSNNGVKINNLTIDKVSDVSYIKRNSNPINFSYSIHLISDVNNPLLGKNGANAIYARQKGASESDISILEDNFSILKNKLANYTNSIEDTTGDGANGGLSFTLKHIFNAEYHQGGDFCLDLINFDQIKDNYDAILTGEGCFDSQTSNCKAINSIIKRRGNTPVILLLGSKTAPVPFESYSIYPDLCLNKNDAISNGEKYFRKLVGILKKKYPTKASHSFPAFINKDTSLLILGSFPSVKSREEKFYYMNKYNRFYKVLSAVFNDDFTGDINSKKAKLKKHKIGLYDVIEECEIDGSKDSSISSVKPIDLDQIIDTYDIHKIVLNGKTAQKYFEKYFPKYIEMAIYMPSTSPANAKMKLEDLIEAWKSIRL